MFYVRKWLFFSLAFEIMCVLSPVHATTMLHPAVTQTMTTEQLEDFANYPAAVKQLITQALILAGKNLTYTYGSANPAQGGMDCSGTIFYILKLAGVFNVPRQSDELYRWVWQQGKFYAVNSHSMQSFEFALLKPGDLLFWSGTYTVRRDSPITHVMLYIGKNSEGQPIMFGASDGRTYQNNQMWGVSIFDFKLPKAGASSRFLGYSCIPTLTCN